MQFSQNSRVWVYQSDKQLNDADVIKLQIMLDNFTIGWTAHNNQLKAKAEIRYNRFIVLIVDESQAGASGCSIDKSVRFMKDIEQELGINLFDRFNLAYRSGEQILSVPRHTFEGLISNKTIDANTTVFNNMVQNLTELETKWEVPFKDSWHIQLFSSLLAQ
ncbi:ABC transporter ATPase [Mucilaginibacter sp. L196]|uniref:ABC transporter ATPase n=1 Tax=Mucilaginibacter sp. L196 TaxID=1641870 RepID=UPI00131C829E|nr:ABC transporter ATPase [Mucilaginibacter sp. L196]